MSRPTCGDNAGRYRTPNTCGYCGGTEHGDYDCQNKDEAMRDQLRADEAAAIDEIAAILTTKVLRVAWVRAVLGGFRMAQRIEDRADARELTDFLKSDMQSKEVRRG